MNRRWRVLLLPWDSGGDGSTTGLTWAEVSVLLGAEHVPCHAQDRGFGAQWVPTSITAILGAQVFALSTW